MKINLLIGLQKSGYPRCEVKKQKRKLCRREIKITAAEKKKPAIASGLFNMAHSGGFEPPTARFVAKHYTFINQNLKQINFTPNATWHHLIYKDFFYCFNP